MLVIDTEKRLMFNLRMRIWKMLEESSKPIFIAIAGGSASGKSTISEKLVKHLNSFGIKSSLFMCDNYYFAPLAAADQQNIPKRAIRNGWGYNISNADRIKQVNWDNPSALDIDSIEFDLDELSHGKEIKYPSYKFSDSQPLPFTQPAQVYVVDGLYLLNKTLMLTSNFDIKVFVHTDLLTRTKRRMKRDENRLKVSSWSTFWRSVRQVEPGFYRHVYGSRYNADIWFRSK